MEILSKNREKEKSSTIKEDVEDFFTKNVHLKRKQRDPNGVVYSTTIRSCVHYSKDDIEATQESRVGLVWTDVLSKYTLVVPILVVPIKSKSVADVIGGTMEALETMQAKPKIRYTDEAGSTRGAADTWWKVKRLNCRLTPNEARE